MGSDHSLPCTQNQDSAGRKAAKAGKGINKGERVSTKITKDDLQKLLAGGILEGDENAGISSTLQTTDEPHYLINNDDEDPYGSNTIKSAGDSSSLCDSYLSTTT